MAAATPAAAAIQGYTITSFDAIRVDAPVTVMVTTGAGASARAEGDQKILDRLRVDVSGRLLTVSLTRPQAGEKNSGGTATLRLSTGMVDRLILTGGGLILVDRIKTLRSQIALGGNGDVSVKALDVDQLDLTMSGGGRATIGGKAGVATIRVSGAGTVAAEGLRARQARIVNDGPGTVQLTADVTATVTASGAGDVLITGRPACTADNRGTGRIQCGGETF